jgi:hypothetical protein
MTPRAPNNAHRYLNRTPNRMRPQRPAQINGPQTQAPLKPFVNDAFGREICKTHAAPEQSGPPKASVRANANAASVPKSP